MSSYLDASAYYSNNLLAHYNDVSKGHSGSAVYRPASPNVLGIVTHQEPCAGGCTASDPTHGPRFRTSMWNDVCTWMSHPAWQSAFGSHALCN